MTRYSYYGLWQTATACNKNDVRYIIGCKTDDGRVTSLYVVKSPANCFSNGASQFKENSAWKMDLDMPDDEKWMERYIASRKEIEERLDVVLEIVVKNDAFIKPKLITWEGNLRTNFHGAVIPFCSSVRLLSMESITRTFLSKNVRSQIDKFPAKSFWMALRHTLRVRTKVITNIVKYI